MNGLNSNLFEHDLLNMLTYRPHNLNIWVEFGIESEFEVETV